MVTVRPPVRGRVPVRRGVTAADVAAVHAQTQVHPAGPDAKAVLATVTRRHHVYVGRPEVRYRCSWLFLSLAGVVHVHYSFMPWPRDHHSALKTMSYLLHIAGGT